MVKRQHVRSIAVVVVAVVVSFASAAASTAGASVKAHGSPSLQTMYDTTTAPLPPNMVSEAFESTGTASLGNMVTFAPGTLRTLSQVTVTLSSWGCQDGTWSASGGVCTTTPGSTFSEPITFSVFNIGPNNTVGSVLATETSTFNIPYRPTSTPGLCGGDDTEWADLATSSCYHGLDDNVSFNFPAVSVPNDVIYSIAYNTSDFGAHPYGDATACHATNEGCGYDSLNVALLQASAPLVGTDPIAGTVYENSEWDGTYCDNGAGGTGTFRLDSLNSSGGCANPDGGWSVDGPTPDSAPWYIPAVQFSASTVTPSSFPANSELVYAPWHQHFSTTITARGNPTPTITASGAVPGLTVTGGALGTITIAGTPTKLGIFILTFVSTNGVGPPVNLSYVMRIGVNPFFETTATATSETAGHSFLFKFFAAGTPMPVISESGALPSGVSFQWLGNGRADLTGVTSTHGTFHVRIIASSLMGVTTKNFTLRIH